MRRDEDVIQQLDRLAAMHASGVLSDQEFTAAKQQVLGSPGSEPPRPSEWDGHVASSSVRSGRTGTRAVLVGAVVVVVLIVTAVLVGVGTRQGGDDPAGSAAPPLTPSTVEGPAPAGGSLPAPALVSPDDGSVFSDVPRTTRLVWSPVDGAAGYQVAIEFDGSPGNGDWTGGSVIVRGNTDFTWDFVGAQPGRWRVSTVDAAGQAGPASEWRYFTYTQ